MLGITGCVVEGVMLSVSAGSSFPVVCLVSYPAAASAAAAAGPDQDQSFLCHDRQTDLHREIREQEKQRRVVSFDIYCCYRFPFPMFFHLQFAGLVVRKMKSSNARQV